MVVRRHINWYGNCYRNQEKVAIKTGFAVRRSNLCEAYFPGHLNETNRPNNDLVALNATTPARSLESVKDKSR